MESEVTTAARTLRQELSGSDDAGRAMADQIAELLHRADAGQDVDADLIEVLSTEPAVRSRLAVLLPPEDGERSGYSPLPGLSPMGGPGSPAFEGFICPVAECGYRYPVFEAGEEPPPCPRHGCELILAV